MLFLNRSQEIKKLLRDGAQAERKKILATTGGNCEIRRAFERKVQEQAWKRPPGQTLSWWTPEIESAHRDWLSDPGPAPVLYEALDPTKLWVAGQPVLLTLDGQQTLSWLRLSGLNFSSRWLRGDMQLRRVDHCELTLRDPKKTWPNAFELQLGKALLCALNRNDVNHQWLASPYTKEEIELERLLLKAQRELEAK